MVLARALTRWVCPLSHFLGRAFALLPASTVQYSIVSAVYFWEMKGDVVMAS